jgi:hypothetical protein
MSKERDERIDAVLAEERESSLGMKVPSNVLACLNTVVQFMVGLRPVTYAVSEHFIESGFKYEDGSKVSVAVVKPGGKTPGEMLHEAGVDVGLGKYTGEQEKPSED